MATTKKELLKALDSWWQRLYKEKPLTGLESVQLQNFLMAVKQMLENK